MIGLFMFSLVAACRQQVLPPEEWQTCDDVGFAFGDRVDNDCLTEVNTYFSVIDEEGDFYRLWGEYGICEVLGEDPGRLTIEKETMEQLRVCGAWLIALSCDEVGEKLKKIIIDKQEKVGQPPECDPLVAAIRSKFKK